MPKPTDMLSRRQFGNEFKVGREAVRKWIKKGLVIENTVGMRYIHRREVERLRQTQRDGRGFRQEGGPRDGP